MSLKPVANPDIKISPQGSVVMFYGESEAGKNFLENEVVFPEFARMGKAYVADWRPAQHVVALAEYAGLVVS